VQKIKEMTLREKQNQVSRSVAKGYRLKPQTHRLIKNLQKKIKGTKDETLSRACYLLDEQIRNYKNK